MSFAAVNAYGVSDYSPATEICVHGGEQRVTITMIIATDHFYCTGHRNLSITS